MDRKALEIKDLTKDGEVEAKIASIGVVDRERDVAELGFFGEQPVSILSSHKHDDLLLGKGSTVEDGLDVLLRGSFNLDDPDAEKLHGKILYDMDPSHGPPIIEWSYGYKVLPGGSRRPDADLQAKGARRILQAREDGSPGALVKEASPVLLGAGTDTGTIAIKGLKTVALLEELAEAGDPEAVHLLGLHRAEDGETSGNKFVDEAAETAVAVKALVDRAEAIADARRNGKLGADAVARLTEIKSELVELAERIGVALVDSPDPNDELMIELARFEAIRSRSV